jgi:hypothetical protein
METLFQFLETMPFWQWWVLALVLLIIEISTGSTYFLWPAAAAVVVGALDLWPLDGHWRAQLAMFAGITILLTVFATPRVKPWLQKTRKDHLNLNDRGAQKIGKRATVDERFENGSGKVRLGDTVWLADSDADENLPEGAAVEIVRVDGAKLIVKRA